MATPVIVRALAGRWRRRTAVAAAAGYFYDKRRKALSASLAFGTVPLDRSSGAGVGPGRTAHLDRLIGDGGSLLVFPEGTRSRDGRVGRLRAGAALPAAELEIRFGKPIAPHAGERPSEVMERVRLFLAECGAETGREPHAEHADRRRRA